MAIRTIEQKITAAAQFTGAAPVGVAVKGDDLESYPAGAAGGLFDFANTDPIQVKQIAIKFGGQSSWALTLVDKDAVEVPLLAGTTETGLVTTTCNAYVLQGQKLKLVTTGATAAMRARISVDTKAD
jgi:hypothetical protein